MTTQERTNGQEKHLQESTHQTSQKEVEIKSEPSSPMIVDYETAPHFMKDNDGITHGYRLHFNTPRKIFRSLFMVHNESVNIWSHCLPAIFIIVFIVIFYLVIDKQAMSKSFTDYRSGIQDGATNYMNALRNLSLLVEYNKFSEQRMTDIQSFKRTVIDNYAEFSNNFQSVVANTLSENTAKFQRAKRQFELILAPLMINEINQKLNSTWFNQVKEKLEQLKNSIDSQTFQMLELHDARVGSQQISRWPIVLFLITAVICLLCSTIFHLFYPMSSRAYTITNRFDYAGINLLISGSAFPAVYYGMYCQLDVAILYLSVTILIASICFVICLFEWIHKPGHQKYKGFLFGGFGCSLAIPLIHMIINDIFYDNYGDPYEFISSVPYYLLLGASYLGGLVIYVKRCPERGKPGKYNMCGHSHQLWHGCVVMGVFWTYLGALANFEMRKTSICPA